MINNQYTITTLGSHSALQILKGAHDEGFKTLVISLNKQISFTKDFLSLMKLLALMLSQNFQKLKKIKR